MIDMMDVNDCIDDQTKDKHKENMEQVNERVEENAAKSKADCDVNDDDDDQSSQTVPAVSTCESTGLATDSASFMIEDMNNGQPPPPNVRLQPPSSMMTTIFLQNSNDTFLCDDIHDLVEEDEEEEEVDEVEEDLEEEDEDVVVVAKGQCVDNESMMTHHHQDNSTLSSYNVTYATHCDDNNNKKKRLRLEDFMRQIITQINTSSEKIWPNLLLDFTKNFSELNIPTYMLQQSLNSNNEIINMNNNTNRLMIITNSDQDLLIDILNIALTSLQMKQRIDRRVFACQLLLNIYDCLQIDTIKMKIMPLVSDLIMNEHSISVRFIICFVLANFAKRMDFHYFQQNIWNLYQVLIDQIISLDQINDSICELTTINFALLDSLSSLLPYLLHLHQVFIEHSSKSLNRDPSELPIQQTTSESVLKFIDTKFIPILKQIFERMLHSIEQYRSMTIKIDQDLFNCYLHWREQIVGNGSAGIAASLAAVIGGVGAQNQSSMNQYDSITQTLYLHFQNLIFFVLILKDSIKNNDSKLEMNANQLKLRNDDWYLQFYYRLCQFHYIFLPPAVDKPSYSSSTLIEQSANTILTKINLMDLGKNNNTTTTNTAQQQNFIGKYQITNVEGNKSPVSNPSTTPATSILQQHLQQPLNANHYEQNHMSVNTMTTNVTIQNNDFSIGCSTQYMFQQATNVTGMTTTTTATTTTTNTLNNLDIFGFFRYKSISCKIIIASLVPAIADLYDIGKDCSFRIENSDCDKKQIIINNLIEVLRQLTLTSPTASVTTNENNEIIKNIMKILEKFILQINHATKHRQSTGLYCLLVNILKIQNIELLEMLLANFIRLFNLLFFANRNSDMNNCTSNEIEQIIEAFLSSETYMNTTTKWRSYIKYYDILFELSKIIPIQLIKRLIIPRLLLRFNTTRPIPCRQAIARCLLMVFMQNFSSHIHSMYSQELKAQTDTIINHYNNEEQINSSFNLFEWIEHNLRQSAYYQNRQIYIDILAIFLLNSLESNHSESTESNNHYLIDLSEYCPSLMQWSRLNYRVCNDKFNLNDLNARKWFAMLTIYNNQLLQQLTQMATNDRVVTIRASSLNVLYSYLHSINEWIAHFQTSTFSSLIHSKHLNVIIDYFNSYIEQQQCSLNKFSAENLFSRHQKEQDRIVSEELHRIHQLVDQIRSARNGNYRKYYQKQNEKTASNSSQIDENIIQLINDLISTIEKDDDKQSMIVDMANDNLLLTQTVLESFDSDHDEGIDLCNDLAESPSAETTMHQSMNMVCSNESIDTKKTLTVLNNDQNTKKSTIKIDKSSSDECKTIMQKQQSIQAVCAAKKRKSPKQSDHEPQEHFTDQQNRFSTSATVTDAACEKHFTSNHRNNVNTKKMTNIKSNHSKGVMTAAEADLAASRKKSWNSHHHQINRKTGTALLPTPSPQSLSSKVPVLSNRAKYQQTPTTATSTTASSTANNLTYPGYCFRIVHPPLHMHTPPPAHHIHQTIGHRSSIMPVLSSPGHGKIVSSGTHSKAKINSTYRMNYNANPVQTVCSDDNLSQQLSNKISSSKWNNCSDSMTGQHRSSSPQSCATTGNFQNVKKKLFKTVTSASSSSSLNAHPSCSTTTASKMNNQNFVRFKKFKNYRKSTTTTIEYDQSSINQNKMETDVQEPSEQQQSGKNGSVNEQANSVVYDSVTIDE